MAADQLEPAADLEAAQPAFTRFRRRTFETFVSLAASTVASAAYAVLVARAVGPSGKGVVSVLFLLPGFAALLLVGTLELANTYFGAQDARARPALLANGLVVSLAGGGVVSVLTFVVLYVANAAFGATWLQVAVLAATIVPTCISRVATVLILAASRTGAFNLVGPAVQVVTLAFTAIAFAVIGTGVWAVIAAYAASQVVAMVLSLTVLRLRPAEPSTELLARSVRYGSRGMLGNLVQFFNYRLDFFLLSSLRSPTAVGVYSISVTLAELVLKLPTAASTILFPRVAASRSSSDDDFTARVARTTAGLAVVSCVALAIGSAFLIGPIFGDRFTGAYVPLVLLLPGVVALSVTNILASYFAGRGEPQYLTYSAVIGLVLTVVLNLALMPSLGASGAAIASSASYGAAAIFVIASFARRTSQTALALLPRPRDLLAWKTQQRS